MNLHEFLDTGYPADGADQLQSRLKSGADPNSRWGPLEETALHVAARRRRCDAAAILLDSGVDIDAVTAGGKTAYAHAARRGFSDMVELLAQRGASLTLNAADRFAVAVVEGRLSDAQQLLEQDASLARTGNPEEDRLLADVAGRNEREPVQWLVQVGADLEATGLDSGTALHQAAWFGQPANAELLIAAGAPLEWFDTTHQSSPLGWAVHGSRYSGGCAERESDYVAVVELLLQAGARLHYPEDPHSDSYRQRLLADASPRVARLLREAR